MNMNIKNLSDLQESRWTLQYPHLGTGPVSLESYSSPEFFERIRENVFKKTWFFTGKRVDELPKPGDFFLEDVEITGNSIIVVRGVDGVIRGFHNTCKHRGTQLVFDSYGSLKGRLRCIYHGWCYGLNGKNILVTEKDMFFDIDKMDKDLCPVSVGVWAGFIFVNLDPDPKESLEQHLGKDLMDLFADYPFERTTVHLSYRADLDCSWPVLRDSQLDGYHLKYLHYRSAPGFMENEEAPNRHAYDFKLLGKHNFGSFYGDRTKAGKDLPTRAPVASLVSRIGQTLASNTSERGDADRLPKAVNPTKANTWFFDILYIFPNMHIIFVGYDAYAVHKMMPGKQFDKASWNARYFAPPVNLDNMVDQWTAEYMKYSLRDLWREDGNTTVGAQASINAGVIRQMYLQDQEIMIRHAEAVLHDVAGSKSGQGSANA